MKKPITLLAVAVVVCGGVLFATRGGSVDENKPIAEITSEAKELDADALRGLATDYKDAILAKRKGLDGVQAKLKDIPLTDITGEAAVALKADIDDFTKSVSALTERFNAYVTELKAKGEDVSGLTI
jgi:hypothetical protein